jgi:hypothetical protein
MRRGAAKFLPNHVRFIICSREIGCNFQSLQIGMALLRCVLFRISSELARRSASGRLRPYTASSPIGRRAPIPDLSVFARNGAL